MNSIKRRAGRFRIAASYLNEHPELVRSILRDCIVVRAEWQWAAQAIEYDALADFFPEVKEGVISEVVPMFRDDVAEDGTVRTVFVGFVPVRPQ